MGDDISQAGDNDLRSTTTISGSDPANQGGGLEPKGEADEASAATDDDAARRAATSFERLGDLERLGEARTLAMKFRPV